MEPPEPRAVPRPIPCPVLWRVGFKVSWWVCQSCQPGSLPML